MDNYTQEHPIEDLPLEYIEQIFPTLRKWKFYFATGVLIWFITQTRLYFVGILGIPLPTRFIGAFGESFAIFFFVLSHLSLRPITKLVMRPFFSITILVFTVFTFLLFAVGILYSNIVQEIFKDLFSVLLFVILIHVGSVDYCWRVIEKKLVVLFWVFIILIFLGIHYPAVEVSRSGTEILSTESNIRYSNTLGYGLRIFASWAILLLPLGMTLWPKNRLWSLAMMASLIGFFLIDVVVFKFRSSAIFCVLLLFCVTFYKMFLEHKISIKPILILGVVLLITAQFFLHSEAFVSLEKRFTSERSDLWVARLAELKLLTSQVPAWGKGMGGSYDASSIYDLPSSTYWETTHIGIFLFYLKGGLPYMFCFLFLLLGCVLPKPLNWRKQRCNLVASCIFPFLLFTIVVNPIGLASIVGATNLLILGMVLGRYASYCTVDELIATSDNWY